MKQKAEIFQSALLKYSDCEIFLHNTREHDIVKKILSAGFIFENQLPHTSDRINPSELIEIAYFLFHRKEYGPFTIVMAIPKHIYSLYTRYSNKLNIPVEELMSKVEPWLSDNDEYAYILPPEHIAGYFSNDSMEFVENALYNPDYLACRDRIVT